MAQPVVNYNGNYITCYPGSNQKDDGKLNLEFNMARFVTRVTSKNFCIVKPSYEVRALTDASGNKVLEIGVGQCSINGMDLIMTGNLNIGAPESAGEYYLAFRLARDSSNNVEGDLVEGVDVKFQGLTVTYHTEKIEDPDVFYIAKVVWSGASFTSIEEDEDKYGRIWAEDILCKIVDPKHPDFSRLTLQDWLYKVPDWYFSKEGDICYGAAEFYAGRTGTKAGVKILAETENNSKVIIKAPSIAENDANRIITLEGTTSGTSITMGKSKIETTTNSSLTISTPEALLLSTDKKLTITGKTGVELKSGSTGNQPSLLIQNHEMLLSDGSYPAIKYDILFAGETLIQETFGKAIWQYNTASQKLSLLPDDLKYLDILTDADFSERIRSKEGIFLGSNTSFGSETTYLKPHQWKLTDLEGNENIVFNPENILLSNKGDINTTSIGVQKYTGNNITSSTKIYDGGKIELTNTSATSAIIFRTGTESYNATISHGVDTTNKKSKLTLSAHDVNFTGNITASGDIRANRVYNAVYNDLAEFFEKEDKGEFIEAGDVVYFTESGKVTKYGHGVNPRAIAGVVSSEETYGFVLGGDGLEEDQKVPVGLCGRVYLKTDIDVRAGDLLAVNEEGEIQVVEYYDQTVLGMATSSNKFGKVYIKIL